jgi:hypothetical protein
MTAEAIGRVVWAPDPVRQKNAGHTIDDVLVLPDESLLTRPFGVRLPIREFGS